MTYAPTAGQIWPQGQPRQGRKNRFFKLFQAGQYDLQGYEQPFSSDADPADPFFSNVTLLLPFDGADGSTVITDASSSQIVLTRSGSAVISTAESRFGDSSLFYPSTGGHNLTDGLFRQELLLDGDYTVECHARTTSTADQILCGDDSTTNTQIFRLNLGAAGRLYLYLNGNDLGSAAGLININTWYHLAATRSGSTTRLFIDGVLVGTATSSNNLRIRNIGSVFSTHFRGNIDNFRVTKGVARYTANFTPPTEPFPLQGGPAPEPEPENPIFSVSAITYTQSSVYGGTAPASNQILTDGSFTNTGVATNNGPGQFVQMDLGGVFSVDRIVIGTATSSIPGGWSKAYTENRTVQHSLDGTTWTNTFNTGTFAANGIYTFNVDIQARYIRIIDTSNGWIAISEFYALAPEPGTDPYLSSVSLLLHMDGSNGSTTFTDSSSNAHAITVFGNAQVSTANPKYGTGSALFDGSGDYLTTPYLTNLYDWWSSDYTIEAWVYAESWATWSVTSMDSIPCMVGNTAAGGVTAYWSFGPEAGGRLKLYYFNGAEAHNIVTGATLPTSQWNHIAAVKTSLGVTLYINGISSGGVFSISGTPQSSASAPVTIGSYNNRSINGRIDDLRITKGVARYTANFTPPTAPFPD